MEGTVCPEILLGIKIVSMCYCFENERVCSNAPAPAVRHLAFQTKRAAGGRAQYLWQDYLASLLLFFAKARCEK